MMQLTLLFYDEGVKALAQGVSVDDLVKLPVREKIGRFKYVPDDRLQAEYDQIGRELSDQIEQARQKEEF